MLQNSPSRGLIAIGKSEFLAVFSNAKIPSLFLITILSIAPLPLRRLYRERSPITHQERSPVTPNTKHWDDCTEIDRPSHQIPSRCLGYNQGKTYD
ncbi:hypothetical protein QUA32_08970 [Microcoleus sp. Pol14D6]|uniref:hypothetical protein n=1 Tax=unclassified Microcoleus TaxID=2642155 RepID=UPI002FCEC988